MRSAPGRGNLPVSPLPTTSASRHFSVVLSCTRRLRRAPCGPRPNRCQLRSGVPLYVVSSHHFLPGAMIPASASTFLAPLEAVSPPAFPATPRSAPRCRTRSSMGTGREPRLPDGRTGRRPAWTGSPWPVVPFKWRFLAHVGPLTRSSADRIAGRGWSQLTGGPGDRHLRPRRRCTPPTGPRVSSLQSRRTCMGSLFFGRRRALVFAVCWAETREAECQSRLHVPPSSGGLEWLQHHGV